jgi:hypothetical protein
MLADNGLIGKSQMMFDWVPIRVWLLLLAATLAVVPAKYVVRHLRHAPNRRDITQAPEDLSWRSSKQLATSLIALTLLAGFSIFIFTPEAVRVAASPRLFPAIILGVGGWSLFTVARGFYAGKVEPLVRGHLGTFDRDTQPNRYWASMAWNAAMGCLFIWMAIFASADTERETLTGQCEDKTGQLSSDTRIAACSSLLGKLGDEDRDQLAWVIATRGSAYRDQKDWERAFADFSRVIALNPNAGLASYAYFYRANIFLYRYQLQPALKDLTAAIQLTPDQAELYDQRAWVYEHLDDEAHAAADRKKLSELQTEHPIIMKKDGSAA